MSSEQKVENSDASAHKKNVMIGTLPDGFLQISGDGNSTSSSNTAGLTQEERDRQTAVRMQNEIIAQARHPVVGRLEISLVSASLNKNYGLSRMDPYARLRVGHSVYETHTHTNGAKTPAWNKTFQIYNIHRGIQAFSVEIYDERTLTEDELIAWTSITIPESVYNGEVSNEWHGLSGKLGDDMEGSVHVVISYGTGPAPMATPMYMTAPIPYGYAAPAAQVPVYTLPYPPVSYVQQPTRPIPSQVQQPRPIDPEDLKQLKEMFPEVEDDVIKTMLEAANGDKGVAANNLLQM